MHYEILRNDPEALVVKFNPAAYVSRLVCFEKPNPKAVLSFNCNYFWGKAPIGKFESNGWIRKLRLNSRGERPFLEIGGCVIEAGPLLGDWKESMKLGDYSGDVARKTSHTAIGKTDAGKLVVAYFRDASMDDMGREMAKYTNWAMKLDGGHSAYLRVGDLRRGKQLFVGVELEAR